MSHAHIRKEADCLNCGVLVAERYCPHCGQENLEPKQSAGHLVAHFFNDVTHFDGKFFSSIKLLITKPGFLTEEYLKGRRASYLDPIRMYLFISAVFFLLLMSVFKTPADIISDSSKANAEISGITREHNATVFSSGTGDRLTINDRSYTTVHEYDSVQKALPAAKRDGFINHYFSRKLVAINERYKDRPEGIWPMMKANYFHSLPYMLFISLPIIALLFQLFYIRRKQFYYVSHGIFTIHLYCFVFIALIAINSFAMVGSWGKLVNLVLKVWAIVYLFLAMKRFYKQGGFKTFAKFVIIFFIGSTLVGVLALIFLIKSFLNVA
ncbi:DUF3667 domain-containing protein [Polluticoccus soli]|uniref:DUF3667 domain-containing protein n=1 Tax=Polluticoccus soli TaxID=3034150 RepID=UPI0023E23BF3|nr:DUF3667 domain-containing protein [Flavipsychrobacter sp. JY13-12]